MQLPRNGWGAYSQKISGRYLALTLATTGLCHSTRFHQGRPGWHLRHAALSDLVEDAGWTSTPRTPRGPHAKSTSIPTSHLKWQGFKLPPRESL
eukprot:4233984-Karenia_brevis.AAC.1